MKRSTKLALSIVLAAGAAVPAFAQDNFPDVPANHWAYEALARMKRDGLLVGYPDGLYRGGRPASRYELAVAMHAVYTNLKNVTDGLDAQLKALSDKVNGMQNPGDIQALRDAITALQNDVAAMKGYGDDIAALKRAAETFDRELKSLGVDVEAMKKDLGDLAQRVSALEKKKPAVDVSGDVNLFLFAGNSSGDQPGLSVDGRPVGFRNGGPVGLTDDLGVLHEAAFKFTGTNETGPKWTGTVVVGNMISDGTNGDSFGSQSVLPGGIYEDGVGSDAYVQNLEVMFGAAAFGLGFDFTVGRVGHKVSPYLFQRIDNTSYYSNERWDNGNYYLDGGVMNFAIGSAKFTAFGGRTSERFSVGNVDLNQVVLGNNRVAGGSAFSDETVNLPGATSVADVDRALGLQLAFPLTKVGNLNLAYLWLDSDETGAFALPAMNRVAAFGGDADFTFGRIKVEGGYHQTTLNDGTDEIIDGDNFAWNAKVGFTGNKFNIYGNYREVANNYIAPGDWGRLGILRNPGNIKGWQVGGSLDLGSSLTLSGMGEFDKGLDDVTGGFAGGSIFGQDTDITSYLVRLDYKISPQFSIYGSYEDTKFSDLTTQAADAKYRFSTLGIGYGLSSNAKLNLAYQVSDVSNEAFLANGLGPRYKGGFLTTQLTIKF